MFDQTVWLLCPRVLLVVVLVSSGAWAGVASENVAVVVNGDSEPSKIIASEYVRLRDIPAGNVVSITGLKDKEKLSVEDFRQQVLGPVLKTLAERSLTGQIDVIAYSAEIPTAIDVSGDLAGKTVPRIFTPTASINGLTFLHQAVMGKDSRYLDLNINRYARRVMAVTTDTPWTADEQRRYAEVLARLQKRTESKPTDNKSSPEDSPEAKQALLKDVLPVFEELQKAHPRSSELHYNRACGLAQLDQFDAAVAALKDAMKSGWWDHRHTARDDDLKPLRGREDFKALLEEMKTIEFTVQPSIGFRGSLGWLPDGSSTADPEAPRYLLSTVLACTTGRGTSVDEALANLRKTAAADGSRPTGTIYFERNGDIRATTREWAFRNAARKLESLGVKAVIEDGVLPQQRTDVAGAVIGIADFDWAKSGSTILPGAIVEHLTSFGGVMTAGAGQTPLTEFLKQGAAGSSGTVTEPFAIQAKFPSPFVQVHYASGCTLAESFYQSVTGPYQLLIVGDPLAQPWRRRFVVELKDLKNDGTVAGDMTLEPTTESPDGITPAAFELFVDGVRITTVKAADPLRWDTRKHADGTHAVTILARGNDAVETVARVKLAVTIQNAIAENDTPVKASVESAHREIWHRFVDSHGILLDFTDGRSHYPMGSNDQRLPWLVGLWRYWQSGIATPEEKVTIASLLMETVEEIVRIGGKMSAEPPLGTRGSFEGFHFDEVARKLFALRLRDVLTDDAK